MSAVMEIIKEHTEKHELRIAELEATMRETAHQLMTMATASEGHIRNRLCTAANRLNAKLGRQQSSHGEQFTK